MLILIYTAFITNIFMYHVVNIELNTRNICLSVVCVALQ